MQDEDNRLWAVVQVDFLQSTSHGVKLRYVTSKQKFMHNHLLAVVCEGEPQQVVAVVTRTAQAFERHSPVDARLLNPTGSFVVDEHEASVVMKAEAAFLVLPRNR